MNDIEAKRLERILEGLEEHRAEIKALRGLVHLLCLVMPVDLCAEAKDYLATLADSEPKFVEGETAKEAARHQISELMSSWIAQLGHER